VSSTDAPSTSRPQSPNSALLYSRVEEKRNLPTLNDRLASYIDRVRELQAENDVLISRIQTSEETVTREVTRVKNLYEKELTDLRGKLEGLANDKTQLRAQLDKEKATREDYGKRLSKKETEVNQLESRLSGLETEVQKLRHDLSDEVGKRRRLEAEKKDLGKDLDEARKQIDALRKHLENESNSKNQLEEKLRSAVEKHAFEKSVLQEELTKTKTTFTQREEVIRKESEQVLEQRLADELAELRADNDERLRACRAEMEAAYTAQVDQLKGQLKAKSTSESKLRGELQTLQGRAESWESHAKHLEGVNSSLTARIGDLEKLLEQERKWHEKALDEKDKEINSLNDKIKTHMKEYQDLYDVKIALDMEIDTYRKLLEGEESRLSIQPGDTSFTSRPGSRLSVASGRTPLRGKRRARVVEEEETYIETEFVTNTDSVGNIEISDADNAGQFVRIDNTGKEDIPLNGWNLVRRTGDGVETTFKFQRTHVIKPGTSITIWSQGVKGKNNPPSDITMKNQSWATAPEMTTLLLDGTGKEMAKREVVRKESTQSSTRKRLRTASGRLVSGDESQEKCCVM